VGLGRIEEMRVLLDALPVLGLRYNRYGTPQAIWSIAAIELRAHGYGEAAEDYTSRAIEGFRERMVQDSSRDWRPQLAVNLYRAGEYAEAYEILVELHEESPAAIRAWGNMGACAARLGRREEAQLISDSLAKWNLMYVPGRKAHFRARISAILGDHGRAVELLREAISNGVGYSVWQHTSELAILLRDNPAYQELMRPRG
jgi:tetratricopeptide (TPR) repeat protein